MIRDFTDRAEECLRLSQRAQSPRDREFFIAMARAWYGRTDDQPEMTEPSRPLH